MIEVAEEYKMRYHGEYIYNLHEEVTNGTLL